MWTAYPVEATKIWEAGGQGLGKRLESYGKKVEMLSL